MKNILLALALLVAGPASAEDPATMTLTGFGEVAATPDMAMLSLGVVTQGQTAAGALGENSRHLARVFDRLEAEGIAAEDMQTTRFSIDPIWSQRDLDSREPPRIDGYTVTNSLSVTLRDLGRIGTVLDTVTQAGANDFGGLQFGLQDPALLQEAARRAAVAAGARGTLCRCGRGGDCRDSVHRGRRGRSACDAIGDDSVFGDAGASAGGARAGDGQRTCDDHLRNRPVAAASSRAPLGALIGR